MNYQDYKRLKTCDKHAIKSHLITLYRDREELWNVKHDLYSNRLYRSSAHKEIGDDLGLDASSVPKIWRTLVDTYSRIKRSSKIHQNSSDSTQSNSLRWAYASQMQFIDNIKEEKKNLLNDVKIEFCDFPSVFHDMDLPSTADDTDCLVNASGLLECPPSHPPLPTTPTSSYARLADPRRISEYTTPLTPSPKTHPPHGSSSRTNGAEGSKALIDSSSRKRKKLHGELYDIVDALNCCFEDRQKPSTTKLKMISLAKDIDDFGSDKKRRILIKQIEDMVFNYTMECINN